MRKLTEAQRGALALIVEVGAVGGLCADDERCAEFSEDGDPDTWNQLFALGLAEQVGPGWSGDDFSLRITPAGCAALQQEDR
jgi:hypothetical protein